MTAVAVGGKNTNADWYKASWEEMELLTDTIREVLLAYKKNPCQHMRHLESC